jgi:hypothetical protein
LACAETATSVDSFPPARLPLATEGAAAFTRLAGAAAEDALAEGGSGGRPLAAPEARTVEPAAEMAASASLSLPLSLLAPPSDPLAPSPA